MAKELTSWVLISFLSAHVYNLHIFNINVRVDVFGGVEYHILEDIISVAGFLDVEGFDLLGEFLFFS